MIKAIVYGVGAMGEIMTKFMVEKGINIVGAIDKNPRICGKDLGEIIGLDYPLNVVVSNNSTTVLSNQQADIAVLSLCSEMEKMYPYIEECIKNGLNVISTSREASYPWTISPILASKLDKLAKQFEVTVSASGYQDVFMVNLVSLLTGANHTIKSITIKSKYDVNDYGRVVAEDMHVGQTIDEFYKNIKQCGIKPSYVRMCLEAIIADLGLTIRKISQKTEPTIDDVDVECCTLGITVKKKEQVTGLIETVEIDTEQGVRFQGEWIGKVYREDEVNTNECFIEGVPNIISKNDKIDQKITTCSEMVNRIPDIINSESGYITYEKLPKLKFRAFPLQYYLKGSK